MALLIVATVLLPLIIWPSAASAAPKPLPGEWWFKMWGVQTHMWPLSTGERVTVAVLDTGVNASLPELQGVVLPGMNAEGGGGDGRRDLDQWGEGHGTGMAAAIAGQGRGTGFVGIAPGAKILPVVTQSGEAYAKGIRFAVDNGAQVINLSQAISGRCPVYLQEAIAYGLSKDAVIVAGAGNSALKGNPSMYPANCEGVLGVGAIDWKTDPWEKSERQPYVDIAAPGASTLVLMGDGKLYRGSGTSDATAFTSAAIALIRARHPTMSNREVVRQLIASAMDVYKKGKDDRTGYGLIRPYRPLAGKAPKGASNPVFEDFDRWMRTRHPERATPREAAKSNGDDLTPITFILPSLVIVALVGIFVFVYCFSRRERPGNAAPAGAQPGVGMPLKYGQRPPAPLFPPSGRWQDPPRHGDGLNGWPRDAPSEMPDRTQPPPLEPRERHRPPPGGPPPRSRTE